MVGRTHALGWIAALIAALPLLAIPAGASGTRARRSAVSSDARAESGWRDPASWRRLRLGMSTFDVLRILGEPGKVTRYYAFERWEYPDALGRRVNFDERGRLIAWGPYAR
jgi:hypothetical protein